MARIPRITDYSSGNITGKATADSTVTIFVDEVSNGTATADGSGNFSYALSGVAGGAHTITAKCPVLSREKGVNKTSPEIWRFVSVQNRLGTRAETWLKPNMGSTTIHAFAQAATKVRFAFNGCVMNTNQVALVGSYTVDKAVFENMTTGENVTLTFSGSQSKTINGGDYHVLSDEISATSFPSACPSGYFPKSTTVNFTDKWRLKVIVSKDVTAEVPHTNGETRAMSAANQAFAYDAATTTVTDISTPGGIQTSGTATSSITYMFRPLMIGVPVDSSQPVFGIAGDSIAEWQNDGGNDVYGFGWFQRFVGGATPSAWSPSVNLAKQGSQSTSYTGAGNDMWRAYIQYCTHFIVAHGVNDFNVSHNSAATMQSRDETMFGILNANGIPNNRIIRLCITPVTTSSDSWATTANQTCVAEWQSGGAVRQYMDIIDDFIDGTITLAGGQILGKITLDEMRAGTDPATDNFYKWIVNGTGSYPTSDGVHPKYPLTANTRTSIRAQLTAMGVVLPS